MPEPLLTLAEAASLLGCPSCWVRKQVELGELTCVVLGRTLRFRREGLQLFADRQPNACRTLAERRLNASRPPAEHQPNTSRTLAERRLNASRPPAERQPNTSRTLAERSLNASRTPVERQHRAVVPSNGGVYFVTAAAEPRLLVKIGVARWSLADRLDGLQAGSPVPLLLWAWVPGWRVEERAMHLRWGAYRRYNEWFAFEGELREMVESLACALAFDGKQGAMVQLATWRDP